MSEELWRGGAVSERVRCVLAANPGGMTLEGTNTWLLREPGAREVVVVDPGPPQHEAHLTAVLDEAQRGGGRVALILLSHHHSDHSGGAARLAELTGAPVRGGGAGPELADDEDLTTGGLALRVLATPGHTADSVCFLVPDDRLLLTGDTVLGRSTTVIVWPDGDLGHYLASLERLQTAAEQGVVTRVAPGHGPVIPHAAEALRALRDHRLDRLAQVRAAAAQGAGTDEIVASLYAGVGDDRRAAAELIVRAQLAHLGHLGHESTPDEHAPTR